MVVVALMATGLSVVMAADAVVSKPAAGAAVFARVNGQVIGVDLYDAELQRAARATFYHRKPPEAQLAKLQRTVGDTLIERVFLLAEARRRGIEPDAKKVREGVAKFEEANRDNSRWQQTRDQVMPVLVSALEESNILERLADVVRQTPEPSLEQLREYFDTHQATFTEPERLRLSVILLKVDPGASQAQRDQAGEEAKRIRQSLAEGADFAALARERSGDFTAPQGGDMGYVHRGMLPELVQKQIEKLAPGELSAPVLLLEGVAIFRMEERPPARTMSFEQSKERAAKLWRAERAERQWTDLKAALRKASVIEVVDSSRYPALPLIDK